MLRSAILLWSVFVAYAAHGAAAVEAVGGVGGTVTSASDDDTVAFTVTSANELCVAVSVGESTTTGTAANSVTSITWNTSQTLSVVASSAANDAAFNGWTSVQWWCLANPTAAAANVVVDYNKALSQAAVHIVSFTGVTGVGAASTNVQDMTANPSVTVADTASGNIVVAVLSTDEAAAATTQANTIIFEAEDVQSDTDHNSQYKTATGANTVMSWTNSGTGESWTASGFALQGSAGSVKVNPISGRGGAAANPVVLGQ